MNNCIIREVLDIDNSIYKLRNQDKDNFIKNIFNRIQATRFKKRMLNSINRIIDSNEKMIMTADQILELFECIYNSDPIDRYFNGVAIKRINVGDEYYFSGSFNIETDKIPKANNITSVIKVKEYPEPDDQFNIHINISGDDASYSFDLLYIQRLEIEDPNSNRAIILDEVNSALKKIYYEYIISCIGG